MASLEFDIGNILTQILKVNMQESYWRAGEQRHNKVWKRSARNAMLNFVNSLFSLLTFPFCQQLSLSVDTPEIVNFLVCEHRESFLFFSYSVSSLFLRSKVDILHHQKSLSRYVTAASLNLTCYHIRC